VNTLTSRSRSPYVPWHWSSHATVSDVAHEDELAGISYTCFHTLPTYDASSLRPRTTVQPFPPVLLAKNLNQCRDPRPSTRPSPPVRLHPSVSTQFSEESGADASQDLPAQAPAPRRQRSSQGSSTTNRDSVLSEGEQMVVRHKEKKKPSRPQNSGAYRFTVSRAPLLVYLPLLS